MSRKKRQSGGSRSHAEKPSVAGSRPGVSACPSCNAATRPDARYCHACGKPLQGQPDARPRDPVTVALYSIIGIAIAGTLAGVIYIATENNAAAPPTSALDSSATRSAPSVDLSSMSPREAADRLFNRIMTAEEQGNKPEVLQFAPMAIQAYERVEIMDADAYFHVGLIHAATGDFNMVRKQVEILKKLSPGHLLGLILEHDAAEQSGDGDAAAKASAAFAAAYDLEITAERPEYQAHRNSIEKFRTETATQ